MPGLGDVVFGVDHTVRAHSPGTVIDLGILGQAVDRAGGVLLGDRLHSDDIIGQVPLEGVASGHCGASHALAVEWVGWGAAGRSVLQGEVHKVPR